MSYITDVDILDESKECFLVYAEEVLTDRAIPSAEDGLLSSQRKILWTMEDYLKMNNKSKTKKCNAIIGSTLATSYFHGDQACYGVLCKMSQEFLMRYPLVQGQGSLGTQEANGVWASSRYTEAKPSAYTDLMMEDFNKKVVPLKETYNGEFFEPVFLPALFPNALCNGRQTIGVSMAHNSLPMNLTEVCNGIIEYIKNKDITLDEIMKCIPGPDFPLGGVVINRDDIKAAFATGHSATSLKVRGDYEIKGQEIIFTSIPYRAYRNKIKEQINKNIDELSKYLDDFNDESGLGINKLIFTVKKEYNPQNIVEKLFNLTDLQVSLSYNMNFIVNGTPKLCSLLNLIESYYNHQIDVLKATAEYDKIKAEERKHILEGLLIAISNIDKAIELIKQSNDKNIALNKLKEYFNITEIQAKAILDMRLAKLTKLDKDDLAKELEEKIKIIENCDKILFNANFRDEVLIDKIIKMRDKYGDNRRTQLTQIEIIKDKEISEVIPEDVIVILTKGGLIKRIPKTSYRPQKKNGKGFKNIDDIVLFSRETNTIDKLLTFSNKGKMYQISVNKIPVGSNSAQGVPIETLLKIEDDETIIGAKTLEKDNEYQYIVFFTKNGIIKKSKVEDYQTSRSSIQAIKLKEGDAIVNIAFLKDSEELMTFTKKGYGIRFKSKDINAIGRITTGVKGINLIDDDEVITGFALDDENEVIILQSNGIGKICKIKDFPLQIRGGRGVVCSSDNLATVIPINDKEPLDLFISGVPNSIIIKVKDIKKVQRIATGGKVINGSQIFNATLIKE